MIAAQASSAVDVVPRPVLTLVDSPAAARSVGLRYVTDALPGIRRRGRNRFRYFAPGDDPVRDPGELARIRTLAIPPAWTDVWICPRADGHLQATGRDARMRKQYRYHVRWRTVRDETKFERMAAFAGVLPELRSRVEEDLALPGLPRRKVLALVVQLLETTLIRVGNREYARANQSFGLTTMRNGHVRVQGENLRFRFRGKSGKEHCIDIRDRRMARLVRRCQDLPGHELFQYVSDDGGTESVSSGDVNEYLRSVTGEEFSAKDFRTWAGTVLALHALEEVGGFESDAEARRNVTHALEIVAGQLGNTVAVCRSSYVHPAIIERYLNATLTTGARRPARAPKLRPDEKRVLHLIRPGSR